jgi:hypothetical protein
MTLDPGTVKTIKGNLAGTTSDELREILKHRDASRWSDEAFAAAQELLDDRAQGRAKEPLLNPLPPPVSEANVEDAVVPAKEPLLNRSPPPDAKASRGAVPAPTPTEKTAPVPGHSAARILVVVLRFLAVVAAVWTLFNVFAALETSRAVKEALRDAQGVRTTAGMVVLTALLYGTILVGVLLALAEWLNLTIAIEVNTRRIAQQFSAEQAERQLR